MATDPLAGKRQPRRLSGGRGFPIRPLLAVSLAALIVLATAGCGKKAPPKPPEGQVLPPPVSDLAGDMSDGRLELKWTVPPTTARYPLPPAGFTVLAFKEISGDPCPNCPPNFQPIGTLKVLGQLSKAGGRQAMRFSYALTEGYRYTFTVVSIASDGTPGEASNRLRINH